MPSKWTYVQFQWGVLDLEVLLNPTGALYTLVLLVLYEALPTGQLWWVREGRPDAMRFLGFWVADTAPIFFLSRGLEGGSGLGPRGRALSSGELGPQGKGQVMINMKVLLWNTPNSFHSRIA